MASARRNQQEPPTRDPNAAQRALDAINMRKLGYGYGAIAQKLGYANRGTAHHVVQRELARTLQEPADDVRVLELERLDDLYRIASTRAMKGDLGAIDRCLRIMERRAKSLGLDAPAAAPIPSTPPALPTLRALRPDELEAL